MNCIANLFQDYRLAASTHTRYDLNHICSNNSEHLIRYIPQYNYALIFDYNKENVYGKGSAIFLHCYGSYPYTLGCISVAEENMIKILKTVDKNARICIYPGK